MRYRVHYLVRSERRTAQVEASSPAEAVVKFRHTCPDREVQGKEGHRVLSVSPEPDVREVTG